MTTDPKTATAKATRRQRSVATGARGRRIAVSCRAGATAARRPAALKGCELPQSGAADAVTPVDIGALARKHAVRAVDRLAALMESKDEKLAAAACGAVLERAFGRPGPTAPADSAPAPLELVVTWQDDNS